MVASILQGAAVMATLANQRTVPRVSPLREAMKPILDGFFDGEEAARAILRRIPGSQPERGWSPVVELRAEIDERIAMLNGQEDCGADTIYERNVIRGMQATLANATRDEE